MHQDATWHLGRPQPRGLCVRRGPSPPPQKGGGAPQISGPCLLWPNGWMDQDGTWRGVVPWSRPYCAKWGPSSLPKRGQNPAQFSAHFYCGQTAGCINMPLGLDVGFIPCDFVLDGAPAPPENTLEPPIFRPTSIVAKRLHGSKCHLVRREAWTYAALC